MIADPTLIGLVCCKLEIATSHSALLFHSTSFALDLLFQVFAGSHNHQSRATTRATMAKRKQQYTSFKPTRTVKKSGPPTYECVACGLPDSISITIDKKKGLSRIKCSSASCSVRVQTSLGSQQDNCDIYSDWVDEQSNAAEERAASKKEEEARAKVKARAEAEEEMVQTGAEERLPRAQGQFEVIWTSPPVELSHSSSNVPSPILHFDPATTFRFMDLPANVRKEVYRFDALNNSTTLFTASDPATLGKAVKVKSAVARPKVLLPVNTRKEQTLTTESSLIVVSRTVNREYYPAMCSMVFSRSGGVLLRVRNWYFSSATSYFASLHKDLVKKIKDSKTPLFLSLNAPGRNISPKKNGIIQEKTRQIYHNPDPDSMHRSIEGLQVQLRRLQFSNVLQPVIESAAHHVRLSKPKDFETDFIHQGPNKIKYKMQKVTRAWIVHCKSLASDDYPDQDFQREPSHEFCICRTASTDLDIKCEHVNPVSAEQEEVWAQNKLARNGEDV